MCGKIEVLYPFSGRERRPRANYCPPGLEKGVYESFKHFGWCPNQRFLVIESLKSPSKLTSTSFAGPIIRFLPITVPRKQLEGCQLEKEGPFPAGNPGRSTESVSNMAHPFKPTLIHLKVWLLVSHYGDTLTLPFEWLEGVLLQNTLLENT